MRQLPKEGKKTLQFGSDRNIRGNLSSRTKKPQKPKISIHIKSDRKRMFCLKCTDIVLVLANSPDQVLVVISVPCSFFYSRKWKKKKKGQIQEAILWPFFYQVCKLLSSLSSWQLCTVWFNYPSEYRILTLEILSSHVSFPFKFTIFILSFFKPKQKSNLTWHSTS